MGDNTQNSYIGFTISLHFFDIIVNEIGDSKMEKILFINACVRPESRTSELADAVLKKVNGEIEQVDLYEAKLQIVGLKELEKRDKRKKRK